MRIFTILIFVLFFSATSFSQSVQEINNELQQIEQQILKNNIDQQAVLLINDSKFGKKISKKNNAEKQKRNRKINYISSINPRYKELMQKKSTLIRNGVRNKGTKVSAIKQ